MAYLSRVKREKAERSRSIASSTAGWGSLRRTWRDVSTVAGCSLQKTYSDVVDLHCGGDGESKGRVKGEYFLGGLC